MDASTLNPSEVPHELANQIITQSTLKYLYYTIGAVGLVGNIFVVVVIMTYKKMKNSMTNLFILNQSVGDATVALFLLLTTAIEDDGTVKSGIADELFCRLWLTKMPLWGMMVTSTYNLAALTLERYAAIVYPIWHKNNFTKKKAYLLMALSWIFGPAFNMAYMIPTAGLQEDGSCTVYSIYPSTLIQSVVGVITVVVQYLFPLALLAFYYLQMWRVLRVKVSPGSNEGQANGQAQVKTKPDSMARARTNIIKTLVLVAVSFIVCWTWNQIYYLSYNLGYDADFTCTFYHFTVVMVFCNCCINPFIYIAKYEQFQKGTRALFRIKGKSSHDNNTSAITETRSS